MTNKNVTDFDYGKYSTLLMYYHAPTIFKAIDIAKEAAKYCRVKESYFPEDMDTFQPHVWVVAAVCEVLYQQTNKQMDRSIGYE